MTSMICPNCGGNQSSSLGDGKFKCLYCGSPFEVKEEKPQVEPERHQTTSGQPQVIYVQAPTQPAYEQPRAVYIKSQKSKGTAVLLTFFLGSLGIQWFYLNNTLLGVLSILFCWTWIPAIVSFFQFFYLLFMSSESFDANYNR